MKLISKLSKVYVARILVESGSKREYQSTSVQMPDKKSKAEQATRAYVCHGTSSHGCNGDGVNSFST